MSPGSLAPAAKVVHEAQDLNARVGHENHGFLSYESGFIPRIQPALRLPQRFSAWDELAHGLPHHYRNLSLRQQICQLELLDASEDSLPDESLLRAASILAMLSHAYFYVETRPPEQLPEVLARPWAQTRKRLGRSEQVLTFIDSIVYNFRLVDPDRDDPMRLENLRLLTPTVDNAEERTFYLTQVEILAQCAPLVKAVVNCQTAALVDDRPTLERSLSVIAECLRRVTRESLPKIDANPHSRSFMNPVVWAKSVAPFAVPFEKGAQGPSGTSSPMFNMLDVFLGRKSYETFLGKEIMALRRFYPRFWQEFLVALSTVSVKAHVESTEDPHLREAFVDTCAAYSGNDGLLGRHRMKVYGFLEIAFKVGRSVTIGGFSGMFKDRTWDEVDSELEKARRERLSSSFSQIREARVDSVEDVSYEGGSVCRVCLDVSHLGVRVDPGDHCLVFPENSDDLVARTLWFLGAERERLVRVGEAWARALGQDKGSACPSLPLSALLRRGKIRPLEQGAALALARFFDCNEMRRSALSGQHQRWELWDALGWLQKRGYALERLLQSDGAPAPISWIVRPESPRAYSVASGRQGDGRASARINLLVQAFRYSSKTAHDGREWLREGVASNFLHRAVPGQSVHFSIERAHRFHFPRGATSASVMLASGAGIAPFLGWLEERSVAHREPLTESWLLWWPKDRTSKLAAQVIEQAARANVRLWLGGHEMSGAGKGDLPARRLSQLFSCPEMTASLFSAFGPGGPEPAVYVCGRGSFARDVADALSKHVDVAELVGRGLWHEESFTDDGPLAHDARFFVADVVSHNHKARGLWFVLEGSVYDVSDFAAAHPGGERILQTYAGTDATRVFRRVHGDGLSVDAMVKRYRIGRLFEPSLPAPWGDLYRTWLSALYLVVEMQNALSADHSLQRIAVTRGESQHPPTLYRLQRAVETHERFVKNYLSGLRDHTLPQLWEAFTTLAPAEDHQQSNEHSRKQLSSCPDSAVTRAYREILNRLNERADRLGHQAEGPQEQAAVDLRWATQVVQRLDARLLREVKKELASAVHLLDVAGTDRDIQLRLVQQLKGSWDRLASLLGAHQELTVKAFRSQRSGGKLVA